MGRLAPLAVHVDVVARPTGLEPRVPDVAVALDRSDSDIEDPE